MKEKNFLKLKIIEEEKDMNNLMIGENFLYGKSLINQKENINIGKPITYYKIINKNSKSVEYLPTYDYIEKD